METLKAGKTKMICVSRPALHHNKSVTEDFHPPIKILLKKDKKNLLDKNVGKPNPDAILTHKAEIKDENGNVLVTLYHSPTSMGWCGANVWIETDAEIDISDGIVFLNDDNEFV